MGRASLSSSTTTTVDNIHNVNGNHANNNNSDNSIHADGRDSTLPLPPLLPQIRNSVTGIGAHRGFSLESIDSAISDNVVGTSGKTPIWGDHLVHVPTGM